MKILLYSAFLMIAFASCSPKASINKFGNVDLEPWDDELGFAILLKTDTIGDDVIKVGFIKAGDGGMTVGCDYVSMLNLIQEKAKANGANMIRIMEHKYPDVWSTCHRISAFAYRAEDISKYEKTIKWSENRKLKKAYFKASTENRPFDYRTSTRMMFSWQASKGKVLLFDTWAEFDCLESYIKTSTEDESLVLPIQQLIFDNAEVYSRKVLKEISDSGFYELKNFSEEVSPISTRLLKELDERNDLIIVDITEDRANYFTWRSKVDEELQELEFYYKGKASFRY